MSPVPPPSTNVTAPVAVRDRPSLATWVLVLGSGSGFGFWVLGPGPWEEVHWLRSGYGYGVRWPGSRVSYKLDTISIETRQPSARLAWPVVY